MRWRYKIWCDDEIYVGLCVVSILWLQVAQVGCWLFVLSVEMCCVCLRVCLCEWELNFLLIQFQPQCETQTHVCTVEYIDIQEHRPIHMCAHSFCVDLDGCSPPGNVAPIMKRTTALIRRPHNITYILNGTRDCNWYNGS